MEVKVQLRLICMDPRLRQTEAAWLDYSNELNGIVIDYRRLAGL